MPVVRRPARNTSKQKTRAALLPDDDDGGGGNNHRDDDDQLQRRDSSPSMFGGDHAAAMTQMLPSDQLQQQAHLTQSFTSSFLPMIQDNNKNSTIEAPALLAPPQQPAGADSGDQVVIAISLLQSASRRSFGVAWIDAATERSGSSSQRFAHSTLCSTEFGLPHAQPHQQQQDAGAPFCPDPPLRRALLALLRTIGTAARSKAPAASSSSSNSQNKTLPLTIRWIVNSGGGVGNNTSASAALLADVINSLADELVPLPTAEPEIDGDADDDNDPFRGARPVPPPVTVDAIKVARNNIAFLAARDFDAASLTGARLAVIIAGPSPGANEQQLAQLPALLSAAARSALAAFARYAERVGLAVAAVRADAPLCVSTLYVPPSTAVALQISWLEAHPGAHHRLGRSKEGFSLLSVLGAACATGLGRAAMRAWFAAPSSDAPLLRERHDAVEFLAAPQHRDALEALGAAVARYRDPLPLLRRIASGQHSTLRDWHWLVGSCGAAVQLAELSKQLLLLPQQQQHEQHPVASSAPSGGAARFTMLHRIQTALDAAAAREMERLIRHVVDFAPLSAARGGNKKEHHPPAAAGLQPQTQVEMLLQQQQNTVRVRSGVDAALDEYRHAHADLDNFLAIVAQQQTSQLIGGGRIFSHHAHGAAAVVEQRVPLRAIFLHQGGFLLVLPVAAIHAAGGLPSLVPASWHLCVSTRDELYFKNDAMRELDERVGDIHQAAVRAEADVRSRLDRNVLRLARKCGLLARTGPQQNEDGGGGHNDEDDEGDNSNIVAGPVTALIAELDCVMALAIKAVEENWTRPRMLLDGGGGGDSASAAGVVSLRGCWHPLLSRGELAAVPCPFIEIAPAAALATTSSPFSHRSMVITGPNCSGKTVLMRTVGVCVFLACIGSFVPAEAAAVGMFDAILTNDSLLSSPGTGAATANAQKKQRHAGNNNNNNNGQAKRAAPACNQHTNGGVANNNNDDDDDGMEAGAASVPPVLRSSFGEEVAQVAAALSIATGATLLLLDEFGSGTLAEDGIALLGGVLAYCARLPPARRPSLIATTHFTELLSSSSSNNSNSYRWLTMSTTAESDGGGDDEVFLFVPKPGSLHAAARCTIRIARRCGLPPAVVREIEQELLLHDA